MLYMSSFNRGIGENKIETYSFTTDIENHVFLESEEDKAYISSLPTRPPFIKRALPKFSIYDRWYHIAATIGREKADEIFIKNYIEQLEKLKNIKRALELFMAWGEADKALLSHEEGETVCPRTVFKEWLMQRHGMFVTEYVIGETGDCEIVEHSKEVREKVKKFGGL